MKSINSFPNTQNLLRNIDVYLLTTKSNKSEQATIARFDKFLHFKVLRPKKKKQ